MAETALLTSLVQKHKDSVESKKTDFIATDKKRRAWDSIRLAFNSDPDSSTRTADQLKKKWDNLKSQAKKEVNVNCDFVNYNNFSFIILPGV